MTEILEYFLNQGLSSKLSSPENLAPATENVGRSLRRIKVSHLNFPLRYSIENCASISKLAETKLIDYALCEPCIKVRVN